MKLSIIVVNYNVEHFLEQCLLSVQRAIKGIEAEVWVVDNNSVDGSVEMVRNRFPWVKLIASKENHGFSRGNNLAITQSTGQYVLLLNPDTVVEEDTFSKVITFMDAHPEAGGLGVKMIDGNGRFLPESKRGLPTPKVAFFKIFGLAALFPKSKRFGRYHLGFLSNDEIHEVEILSGAFMFMRKSALDKVGLLDEDFFMYGEDIDLSWRLIQGGYKNYYFPETRIIHYKGESTKKSSINYVFVFYRAMIIFARKHFTEQNVRHFSLFINMAIYFRAGLAIVSRFLRRTILPLLDFAAILATLFIVKYWYQEISNINLSQSAVNYALTIYAVVILLSVYLFSGYEKPLKWLNLFKGVLVGSMVVLVGYSLLPEDMRFSRALTLIGSLSTTFVLFLLRGFYLLIGWPKNALGTSRQKRIAIIAEPEELHRVSNLLNQTSLEIELVTPVFPGKETHDPEYTGTVDQLKEIVDVHDINNVIFCAKDISAQDIISNMAFLNREDIEFKIAPPESLYIIGSNSIHGAGELFVFDINSISSNANRRNKRIFDIVASASFFLFFPILSFLIVNPGRFLTNILQVFIGKYSWVGFYQKNNQKLPHAKPGILHPGSGLPDTEQKPETLMKLNVVYAKDYHVRNDLKIVLRARKLLGSEPLT